MALHRFAAWLADEGEIDGNPLIGVKPPKLDCKVVDALTDEQLRRLIKACAGKELIVLVTALDALREGSAQGRHGNLAVVKSMTKKG